MDELLFFISLVKESCNAQVEYKKVHFNYPTRPGVEVLKGVDMNVTSGQFIALVGSSGCGKTTVVQLLERFYDVTKGTLVSRKKTQDLLTESA